MAGHVLASAGNAGFWGILTRTRVPHPSSRSLSQERRVLTHGASSKSSPAEALVCSFETAAVRVSTDYPSKWPKRRTFLEDRESRAARPEPNLRMPQRPAPRHSLWRDQ